MTSGRFAARHEDRSQVGRALGVERRLHGSGEHDVVVEQFDGDVGARNEPLQIIFQTGNVALDDEIETDDLLAVRTKDEDIRLAHALAEQIDAPRCARDSIGNGRVGDQDIISVGGQIDDHRLVEAELYVLASAVGDDLRILGDSLAGEIVESGSNCQNADRKGEKTDHAERRMHEANGLLRKIDQMHRHFLAPTSETSPDLMRRTVPRRPLPETR